jgi:steroid delta-isomerase-like uncharacterized protein
MLDPDRAGAERSRQAPGEIMTTADQREQNKKTVEQITDVWGSGDVDELDEVMPEDVVAWVSGIEEPVRGREAYQEAVSGYRTSFPDFGPEIHSTVAEGDRVAMHYTGHATHEGDLIGIEPTGESIEAAGISLFRVEDGKVAEETNIGDMLGLFEHLGVVEAPKK